MCQKDPLCHRPNAPGRVTCEHHLDIQRAQTERAQDFVPKEDKCKTCKKEYLVETYGQKNCEPCRAKVRDKTKMKNAKQRTRRKLRAQAMAEEAAATDAAAANFADAHTNGQELGAVPALSWRCPLRPPRERSPDKDIVSAVVLALHAAENVFPSGFVKYILFTPTPLDARNLPSGMRNVHLRCALRTFLDCFLWQRTRCRVTDIARPTKRLKIALRKTPGLNGPGTWESAWLGYFAVDRSENAIKGRSIGLDTYTVETCEADLADLQALFPEVARIQDRNTLIEDICMSNINRADASFIDCPYYVTHYWMHMDRVVPGTFRSAVGRIRCASLYELPDGQQRTTFTDLRVNTKSDVDEVFKTAVKKAKDEFGCKPEAIAAVLSAHHDKYSEEIRCRIEFHMLCMFENFTDQPKRIWNKFKSVLDPWYMRIRQFHSYTKYDQRFFRFMLNTVPWAGVTTPSTAALDNALARSAARRGHSKFGVQKFVLSLPKFFAVPRAVAIVEDTAWFVKNCRSGKVPVLPHDIASCVIECLAEMDQRKILVPAQGDVEDAASAGDEEEDEDVANVSDAETDDSEDMNMEEDEDEDATQRAFDRFLSSQQRPDDNSDAHALPAFDGAVLNDTGRSRRADSVPIDVCRGGGSDAGASALSFHPSPDLLGDDEKLDHLPHGESDDEDDLDEYASSDDRELREGSQMLYSDPDESEEDEPFAHHDTLVADVNGGSRPQVEESDHDTQMEVELVDDEDRMDTSPDGITARYPVPPSSSRMTLPQRRPFTPVAQIPSDSDVMIVSPRGGGHLLNRHPKRTITQAEIDGMDALLARVRARNPQTTSPLQP